MGSPEVGVIVNPQAAAGRGLRLLPRVISTLQELDRTFHVMSTRGPGDAIEIARDFAESEVPLVVAVGGDGTINEVVNGLVGGNYQPCLGVIPAGRGSDFARALGSPKKTEDAVRQMLSSKPRRVDAARATFADGSSRLFVNAGGLGFDAAVAQRSHGSHLPGSTFPYLRGLIGALVAYHNIPATIVVDGTKIEAEITSAIVTNSSYLAGGMRLVPTADITDGVLDLAILRDLTKRDLVSNVPKVYRGTHVTNPKFSHHPVRSVHIATKLPAAVQLDGELFGQSPVTITVEPGLVLVTT